MNIAKKEENHQHDFFLSILFPPPLLLEEQKGRKKGGGEGAGDVEMGSHMMEPDDIATYGKIFRHGENDSSICMSIAKIQSKGSVFFHDAHPLDYSVPLLLVQLSLASLLILFTSTFFKPLGQPTHVIQIFVSSSSTNASIFICHFFLTNKR